MKVVKLDKIGKTKPLNKIITGNEPDGPLDVNNCLSCGMIYRLEVFEKLSKCTFCDEKLAKKANAQTKGLPEEDKAELNAIIEIRDRLIAIDREAAKKDPNTRIPSGERGNDGRKIYDDQEDYFDEGKHLLHNLEAVVTSKWSSKEDIEKAKLKIIEVQNMIDEKNKRFEVNFDDLKIKHAKTKH